MIQNPANTGTPDCSIARDCDGVDLPREIEKNVQSQRFGIETAHCNAVLVKCVELVVEAGENISVTILRRHKSLNVITTQCSENFQRGQTDINSSQWSPLTIEHINRSILELTDVDLPIGGRNPIRCSGYAMAPLICNIAIGRINFHHKAVEYRGGDQAIRSLNSGESFPDNSIGSINRADVPQVAYATLQGIVSRNDTGSTTAQKIKPIIQPGQTLPGGYANSTDKMDFLNGSIVCVKLVDEVRCRNTSRNPQACPIERQAVVKVCKVGNSCRHGKLIDRRSCLQIDLYNAVSEYVLHKHPIAKGLICKS